MDITGNQTVRLRMPVAAASEIDGSKKKGVFAFSTTDQTVAVCPEDGANFVRMGIHPADAPAASSLGGGDIVLIVQGGVLKRTTVSEIGGGGVWQPLDSDLTAIAALTTTPFGRSLLTLVDAPSARSAIGAASSADLSGYQPLDSDLTAIAALTTTPFGRSLLALADGPAVRTAIGAGTVQPSDLSGYQPLDSDLTAIAALATTPFGRSLLTVADAAAARSAIGAGTSSFSGAYASLSGIPAAIDAIDGLTPAADKIPYYTGASTGALTTLTAFARTLMDDADAPAARTTIGAMASTNPNFTGHLYQDGNQRITADGIGRFDQLLVDTLASYNLPLVTDIDGVLRNKSPAEFRAIIWAASSDHNHAGIYAPVPAQTSKSGNWSLDANTTTGILQTSTGTLTLPAASATYASKSYIVTASTALTLTIAGTFCYLDAVNSASYWYDITSGTREFAMNGGHASGFRKKIEIWCDGSEWLVKC